MSRFTGFRLSFFNLLDQHPLYSYRNESGELKILLIGHGQRMLNDILPTVITNGQLLDTELYVTVLNTNPTQSMNTLIRNAPYLPHFSKISCMNTAVFENELEDNRCNLTFEKATLTAEGMKKIAQEYSDYRYIIISTGTDETNAELAQAVGECINSETALVAYAQRKKTLHRSGDAELISFGFDGNSVDFSEELEKIGLNLHNSYARSTDGQCTTQSVFFDFYNDEYTYVSNIEAAVHVKAKLLCCGISCEDLNRAAKEFSKIIINAPELINRLAAVEHDRWVFSKIFAGYQQLWDDELIYRDGNTTHSTEQKWHTCLLPIDHMGGSFITEEMWQAAESGNVVDTDLDPLDRMTLLIHQKCRACAEEHASTVDSLLRTIQGLLAENHVFSAATFDAVEQLSLGLFELRMQKKSAISLYQKSWKKLYNQIRSEGGAYAAVLSTMMESLRTETASLIEYVSRKDYKEQDRILCRSIPYALTHRFRPTVVKLLSGKLTDNIAAIQQMDPEVVTFVGIARSMMELAQIEATVSSLKRYTLRYLRETTFEYSIIVPNELCREAGEEREDIVFVPVLERKALVEELDMLFSEAPAYIDVSGSDLLLTAAAMEYADRQNCGVFYSSNGEFLNISHAEELEYPFPKQGFTVEQMFDINGADTISVESSQITGLENVYQELWNIASEYSTAWKALLLKEMKMLDDHVFKFSFNGEEGEVTLQVRPAVVQSLFPVLQRLVQLQYVRDLSTKSVYGATQIIRFWVLPDITDVPMLQKSLQSFCDGFDPQSMFFGLNCSNTAIQVSGLRCAVSLADEKNVYPGQYKKILERLVEINCIYDLDYNEDKVCTFRFTSPEMRHIMQKTGNAAEAYVYYTALLDCGFDDVENGFHFRHSVASDIENEIDIICASQNRSLFISVKARSEAVLAADNLNYLNMVSYEIRYEAEHFGLNSKSVLAAPELPIFTLTANGTYELSSYARKCRSRGVYLCGKECFRNGLLGRSLVAVMNDTDGTWYEFLRPTTPLVPAPAATVSSASATLPPQFTRFEDLMVGQVFHGKVTNVISKFAFVDVGVCYKGTPMNGAVHISEVSYQFINDINDVMKIGDVIKVVVIAIDREKKQFSLSVKQA